MHYKVLVLGDNVEELLAPYNENIEVAPYVDKTFEECRETLEKMERRTISDKEVLDYYDDELDEDGNLISTYNPKSKWDWYIIGGRWSDEETEYGETVGTTEWKYPKEHLEKAEKFWIDWVEGKNREKYGNDCFMYRPEYYIEKYKNLDNYIKAKTYKVGYAIVTPDGEWHEPGQMGWFSSLGDMEDELDFEINAYDKYIKNLPADTPVYVVDCHI